MSKERQFNLCSGYPVSGMPVQAHAAQEPVAVSGGPYSSMPMPTFQPVGESSADRAARLASELVIEISTASRVNDTVLADRIETKLTEIHDLLLSIDIKVSNTTDPKQFLLDMEEKIIHEIEVSAKIAEINYDSMFQLVTKKMDDHRKKLQHLDGAVFLVQIVLAIIAVMLLSILLRG